MPAPNEPSDAKQKQGKSIYERVKLVAIGVVALLMVIIVLQNTDQVETKILFMSMTMPRAVLLLGTLLIGFALGILSRIRSK